MDIEKLMKPEQTIKDMLKYIGQKGNESLAGQLRTNLSYMLFRFNQTDRDEVYSSELDSIVIYQSQIELFI